MQDVTPAKCYCRLWKLLARRLMLSRRSAVNRSTTPTPSDFISQMMSLFRKETLVSPNLSFDISLTEPTTAPSLWTITRKRRHGTYQ